MFARMKKALAATSAAVVGVATMGYLTAGTAAAAFTGPAAVDGGALLGDSTAGSETGIYEVQSVVQIGLSTIVGILIAFVIFGWVRKTIFKR